MAYSIGSKLYTDNPMLDELVYCAKEMIKDIILKDQEEADNSETDDSLLLGEIYIAIIDGYSNFNMFKYDEAMLSKIPEFTITQIKDYAVDNSLIPNEYRDELLDISCKSFMDEFEEQNNYYRCLSGLPDYKTPEYYIQDSYIPTDYKSIFDLSIPISKFTSYQIEILSNLGILDIIKNENPTLRYLYRLGNKKISVYNARKAIRFELLYINSVEQIVLNRFKEILEMNRIIYTKKHYSQAYKFNSKYYDKFIIIMIISQSVTDLLVELPEWYIQRDIFDIRSVEYILTANGVSFFNVIPLKYQVSIVRNLNKLIKYKSCNKNLFDLAEIFGLDNVNIYKYFLFKKRKMVNGNYIESIDNNKKYELCFVKTPVDDILDNYIKDDLYIVPYNAVTSEDEYWDGVDDHDYIYDQILNKDFTTMTSKYISFDASYSFKDYMFKTTYFLNMFFDNKINNDNINLKIPIINEQTSFSLQDLFILLYIISFNYYVPPNIGTIINTHRDSKIPILSINEDIRSENDDDYLADVCKWFEEDFPDYNEIPSIDLSNRLIGFNLEADLEYLIESVGYNHRAFGFIKGYTLEDLGVDKFKVPTDKSFKDIDEMIEIYDINKSIYDDLIIRLNNCNDYEEYRVYKFTFEYLFTMEMNQDYLKLKNGNMADTYIEYIREHNIVLYNFYLKMMSENNLQNRQYNIGYYVDQIISSIDLYLETTKFDCIFNFLPSVSRNMILYFLSLLIGFFKSYKIQMMDINATLVYNDELENKMNVNDVIGYIRVDLDKCDNSITFDNTSLTSEISNINEPDISNKGDLISNDVYYDKRIFILDGGVPKDRLFEYILDGGDPTTENRISLDGGGPEPIVYKDNTGYVYSNDWNANGANFVQRNTIDGGLLNDESFAEYCINSEAWQPELIAFETETDSMIFRRDNDFIMSSDLKISNISDGFGIDSSGVFFRLDNSPIATVEELILIKDKDSENLINILELTTSIMDSLPTSQEIINMVEADVNVFNQYIIDINDPDTGLLAKAKEYTDSYLKWTLY